MLYAYHTIAGTYNIYVLIKAYIHRKKVFTVMLLTLICTLSK